MTVIAEIAKNVLSRRAYLMALLVAALVVFAGAAYSSTYYVSMTGSDETGDGSASNPWATIDKADASISLSPGDTVMVAAGTYAQSSLNGVTIANCSGSSGSPITYKADGAVVIDQSAFPGESYGIKVAASMHDLVFEGFEIRNCQWGFYFDSNTTNTVVTKCNIHDMLPADAYGATPLSWTGGIWMSHPDHCTISYNLIHNVYAVDSAACLFLPGMTNSHIYNNTLADSGIGIQDHLTDGTYTGNEVANNIFAYLEGHGMFTGTKGGIASTRNLFFGNAADRAGQAVVGLGDIQGDPGFASDYTLQDGSPAINAGIDLGKPFNGQAPDLGAFESASTEALGAVTGKVWISASTYRPARPLADISVECWSRGVSTVTNANGEYWLPLPAGEQTLYAYDLPGNLVGQEVPVTITALTTTTKDIYFGPPAGNTYYVATTGSDETGDGTEANPWATIDYADSQDLLVPGDTVMVAEGTYPQATADGVNITVSGSVIAPIVYKANGAVVIDQAAYQPACSGILIAGGTTDVVIDGFEIKNCHWGIWVYNVHTRIVVTGCKIHGIRVAGAGGSDNWCAGIVMGAGTECEFHNNLIYDVGVRTEAGWSACILPINLMKGNKIYNNTLVDSQMGVYDWMGPVDAGSTVTNNIFKGLWVVGLSMAAQNQVVNTSNLYYGNAANYGGTVSAGLGEVIADPLLEADYTLQNCLSGAVNVGVDLGLPFNGCAPDLGAFESPCDESCPDFGIVTGRVLSTGSTYRPAGPVAGVTVSAAVGGYSAVTGADGTYTLSLPGGEQTLQVQFAPDTPVFVVPKQTTSAPDILVTPPSGNVYYVATTGSDTTGDGSAGNPWATIDHADKIGITQPGDTVMVAAGTYPQATVEGVRISRSGTPIAPIAYKANGEVIVDQAAYGLAGSGFLVVAGTNDIVIDGFEIKNCHWGIWFYTGHVRCEVTRCKIHGIRVAGSGGSDNWCSGIILGFGDMCEFHNNVIYDVGVPTEPGWSACIMPIGLGKGNKIHNNTLVDSQMGIYDWMGAADSGSTVTNNILKGLWVAALSMAQPNQIINTSNLYFGNTADYVGSVSKGAGEFTADPLLAPDYTLLDGSPAIDAGIDVGLPFNGLAPDMGAFETGADAIPVSDIREALGHSDGDVVSIVNPMVATVNSGTFTDKRIYVQQTDRLIGLKAVLDTQTVAIGDQFTLTGTLGTDANGERMITLGSIGAVTPGAEPKSLGSRNGFVLAVAPHLSGTLARLWGKVTYKGAACMYIDDGSACKDGNTAGHVGIRITLDGLSAAITKSIVQDDYVTVTGVLGLVKDGAVTVSTLRPRGDADILVNP